MDGFGIILEKASNFSRSIKKKLNRTEESISKSGIFGSICKGVDAHDRLPGICPKALAEEKILINRV